MIFSFGLRASLARGADSFPLWAEGAPNALGKAEKDIPTLTVFAAEPARATGAAFIICPGGGYGMLADYEGSHYAKYLNEQGITGFVLKYRLAPAGYHHPSMLQDAARAMRTVRSRAQEWGLKTNQIGIMGSSAGGHLATTLLTHYDAGKAEDSDPIERQSSRPDLGILCYPVVTMGMFTHEGSLHNLLGKDPTADQRAELSNELHVTKDTPPCFIWHTEEDKAVPVENSLQFAAALRKAGVPFDLHIYEKGAHGLALGSKEYDPAKWHPWARDCAFWLKQKGWSR